METINWSVPRQVDGRHVMSVALNAKKSRRRADGGEAGEGAMGGTLMVESVSAEFTAWTVNSLLPTLIHIEIRVTRNVTSRRAWAQSNVMAAMRTQGGSGSCPVGASAWWTLDVFYIHVESSLEAPPFPNNMRFPNLHQGALPAILLSGCVTAVKFQEYILAPSDRNVQCRDLLNTTNKIENPGAFCTSSPNSDGTTFTGDSAITIDFGKNIAGTVQFNVKSVSGDAEFIGFTFTESNMWISTTLSDSANAATFDSPLWFPVDKAGAYAADKTHQRGGFRYMSLWHNSTGTLVIDSLSVNFTASPEMANAQDYTGYFNSDSEKLNRVWYAGAYTNQLCTSDPAYGNSQNVPGEGWYLNGRLSEGTSVLMDGAKRDRLVWPGDIAISGPSMFVSTNSLDGIKNGLAALFSMQEPSGRLPYNGIGYFLKGHFDYSFTYHLYTLLDLYDYYTYSGDMDYLKKYWNQYKLGLANTMALIDSTGMANVDSPNDWLRSGMGGHNGEANSIFYHTLEKSITLAKVLDDTALVANWTAAMSSIRTALNAKLWDPTQNLFFDNAEDKSATAVHPQDGNSWAIIAGLVTPERAAAISTALAARWARPYGAPAPEAGKAISPFASGFEVQAHYLAGAADLAVDLMQFMWADFMLDDPRMTNSSLIEGYSADGSLHYPPYDNDARVSHAHGWATGPTSALSFFGAGIQLVSAMGRTWEIHPRMGGLKRISSGYETGLGKFEVEWEAEGKSVVGSFSTPAGTSGKLVLPPGEGHTLTGLNGVVAPTEKGGDTFVYADLPGGTYKISLA
ncbi:hypothetical protein V490_02006 [Pseudogymnoascus sp. VKM F-3557]|nr:hypothetical protein V490_02006 [Pseudogymnoascus sp. VKM F-3557]